MCWRSNSVPTRSRAARTRLAAAAIFAGLGTVLGLYLLWRLGEWSLDKFIYDNPAFAIEQVEVQTDGSIPLEQLRRWSGVRPGENLIRLDLAAVKRNLELVSTLDTVSIERILPRTLKIRVTERRPLAQVNCWIPCRPTLSPWRRSNWTRTALSCSRWIPARRWWRACGRIIPCQPSPASTASICNPGTGWNPPRPGPPCV